MDIRLDVLQLNGRWTVTQSGPDLLRYDEESAAVEAAIASARQHRERTGGHATVHVWHAGRERTVYDTRSTTSA